MVSLLEQYETEAQSPMIGSDTSTELNNPVI